MDDRLRLADTLEHEARHDRYVAAWFKDLANERAAAKDEQARRLREHVAQEREIAELEREANLELMRRRPGRNARAS